MLLPAAAGPPRERARTLTGTMARTAVSAVSGSPLLISQRRRAPVTTASTTSLTVPPCALRTARCSASELRHIP
jgi:hypothetical protein